LAIRLTEAAQIELSWNTISNQNYQLQFRSELAIPNPNQWRVLADGMQGDGNPAKVVDLEGPKSLTQRFYRVAIAGATTNVPPANPDPARLAWIAPGTFTMGSPTLEADRFSGEVQHTVTISQGFWMGKHEVTQGEYLAVMGSNPSYFTGDLQRPVEQVSWNDATNYCGKLTAQERGAGRLPAGYEYRLPTEAEWEYACRAGTTTATAYGDSLSSAQANFNGNNPYGGAAVGPYLERTTAVGSYAPNAWGLYDMHGNVWEWCLDWWGDYPSGSVTDPKGPASGSLRMIRGGAWNIRGGYCRSADRGGWSGTGAGKSVHGFRAVLSPGQ
jgi:formylglycine-generating enzyme required for sulfatase activity